jgi:uncharacterized membrane protein YagU involved in acid resistance
VEQKTPTARLTQSFYIIITSHRRTARGTFWSFVLFALIMIIISKHFCKLVLQQPVAVGFLCAAVCHVSLILQHDSFFALCRD